LFADRQDAGRRLADRLTGYASLKPVVVAMPRGGVLVAAEVAERLDAPLDVVVVRKIGTPWQPELGVGALAEGDVLLLDQGMIEEIGIPRSSLEPVITRERGELARRVERYRGDRPPIPLDGRVAILVDDGLATGSTARAAIEALRRRGAERVILAVPVAPRDRIEPMLETADEVIAVEQPTWLGAIGEAYDDFTQASDEDVMQSLELAASRQAR
jgi:putative phosphoribosyl transferase